MISIKFETEVCDRCHGNKYYGNSGLAGNVCFKCGGSGVVLTEEGHKANNAYKKYKSKRPQLLVSTLQAGQVIVVRHLNSIFGVKSVTVNGDEVRVDYNNNTYSIFNAGSTVDEYDYAKENDFKKYLVSTFDGVQLNFKKKQQQTLNTMFEGCTPSKEFLIYLNEHMAPDGFISGEKITEFENMNN